MTHSNLEKEAERIEELAHVFAEGFQVSHPAKLNKINLTIPQIMVLSVLGRENNCKMSDLAKRLKVSYGNVTGLVDRLVLANLVKRVNDLADRRIIRVALTAKGKKMVDEIKACRRKSIIHLLKKIPNKEKTILFGLLEKIATIIREEEQKS